MATSRPIQLALMAAAAVLLTTSVFGFVQADDDEGAASGPTEAGAVDIVDFTFVPPELTVGVGDTVTWTNQDQAAHTVTSDGDGPLDSPDLEQGATYDANFSEPGTYDYICTIHPTMQGTVEVTN